MNKRQLKRMTEDKGFIAALDQSGGSTEYRRVHIAERRRCSR